MILCVWEGGSKDELDRATKHMLAPAAIISGEISSLVTALIKQSSVPSVF
jgi:hypothetical protein